MKKYIQTLTTLSLMVATGVVIGQNTRFSDPDTVIKNEFWNNLYATGGTSFFCEKAFKKKGFMLQDGYIYPLSDIRTALDCGTSRQCEQDNRYRQIASDLHNMVPVKSRLEMKRQTVRYEQLDSHANSEDCGIKEQAGFFEPPERVKGDVARTMAYMVDTYGLPWLGRPPIFKDWNRQDPPDDTELSRHSKIAEVQGNENPFVTNPNRIERL
ncbi:MULTISPECIES: endonuclease [Marinobacter]|uniref:Endonuclease n=1 Tax=Marinobacter suaedae TaxID=3057675 RepID=A0ABT8VWN1_9GAMM|nr:MULTISPECIES: endonuclease [unclassified Marinobacter]MBZ2168508.1 endonuclease [Marinobacter sp. F4216]MDO3720406.1 endonuclease [Marinobacter sp. chi1]